MTTGWIHPRTDDNSQPLVDFVWGNMPMQPSDDRVNAENPLLDAGDSHSISFTEWNGYPGNTPNVGRTLDDSGPFFYWPSVGFCYTNNFIENRLGSVAKELIACGVPAEWMTPAKFIGGDTWWDYSGNTYDETSGAVFYYYVAPTDTFGTDWQGKMIYGSDLNETVVYGGWNPGTPVAPNNQSDVYLVVFQSHTPALNTANWL